MNATSIVALVAGALFAIGDWLAKARANRRLEYVCKPAALGALIVVACALTPVGDAHARRVWFVLALLASLKGDVLLMFEEEGSEGLFVLGLAAFLVAHVCYLVGFWTDAPSSGALAASALIVLAVVGPLAAWILGALGGEPALRPPVGAYIAVISAMLATALATGNPLAGAGATLFAASDSLIAWNRFVRPVRGANVVIMVAYHLGQAGLVASLLR